MSTPQHDGAENNLAERVPPPAEGMRGVRQTDADADAAISRDDFEDDVEDGERHWIALELARLCDGDEEDGENDPPYVVSQLTAKLLADEVTSRLRGPSLIREGPLKAAKEPLISHGLFFRVGVVGIDAQASLFVDVGVAHCYEDRVCGDVHHDYVEDQEANAETGYGYDVESTTAYGERLEETVKSTSA